MKKFVLYSFLIMFSSCVITETPDSYVEYKIINKSNHKIKLDINYNNNVTHYCILNPDQEFVEDFFVENTYPDPHPFGFSDYVTVFYDDSIYIHHLRLGDEGKINHLYNQGSWEGGLQSDNEYYYRYTFTEEDYLEAKDK